MTNHHSTIDPALVERFRRDLDALIAPEARVGVAASGGPDSMALLVLAAAARPGLVEAASVDHRLRSESAAEGEMVASLCERLGVPHAVLAAEWKEKPATAIQERARAARYRLLGRWAKQRKVAAIVTAHHLDDQAETLLMRLTRGAGVRGLAGMRRLVRVPGEDVALARPLLGWRRSELEAVCEAAGVATVADPSNGDMRFERVRVRRALGEADWLDPAGIAASARNLAAADAALRWATGEEWRRAVAEAPGELVYRVSDAPLEIRRRIVARALSRLGHEGGREPLRGGELDRLLAALASGKKATLRGVLCTGGAEWRFTKAPARRS